MRKQQQSEEQVCHDKSANGNNIDEYRYDMRAISPMLSDFLLGIAA